MLKTRKTKIAKIIPMWCLQSLIVIDFLLSLMKKSHILKSQTKNKQPLIVIQYVSVMFALHIEHTVKCILTVAVIHYAKGKSLCSYSVYIL